MSNSMMNFTKGIVTGVVVGTTVSMAIRGLTKPSRPFKKNMGKAIRNAGTIVNHLTGMIK